MRIAVVSDLHGNLVALEAVLADLDAQAPDLVLHGGDLAVTGPRPAEVVDRIRELGWEGVVGNTDEMLWRPDRQAQLAAAAPALTGWLSTMFGTLAPWARDRLGDERITWLRALPDRREEGGLRLVHARPGNLWRAPMPDATDADLTAQYAPLGGDVAVYGHIHRPFVRATRGPIVANSGSAGAPWDGDPRAAYLLVDEGTPSVRRVAYDYAAAVRDAEATGFPLPELVGRMYLEGIFSPP
jgi:predicted phosphodiesterase